MANDCHVALTGRVMGDPKNRQVNETTVFEFRVAVTTTKRQEGSQYPASDFYDIKVWGKSGERLMPTVKAKSVVFVTGSMYLSDPWKDRNNETHINPIVTADSVKVFDVKEKTPTAAPQLATETEEAPF